MKVGVLALQGDFAEHQAVLERMGQATRQVKLPRDMNGLDGLIIPGGESTTFRRLIDIYDLEGPISQMASQGIPIWGTCAGLIVMARELIEDAPIPLGLLNIVAERNAYGRQVHSFEQDLDIAPLGKVPFKGVFIRAPVICEVGEGVQVLAALSGGGPAAVRQNNLLGTSFHPELTSDTRFHNYFLDMIKKTG